MNCIYLKTEGISSMAYKHRRHSRKEKNLPIPLVLFSSYIAAKKSDELIKEFCKELPGILENINKSKKALKNKKRTVCKLKEDITQDLKKLELAKIVLEDLYKEEESFGEDKEKELQRLNANIATNQNSKKVLTNYLTKYSVSQEELDSVANKSRQYNDAKHLIRTFLTLQAMNEKFIEDECSCAYRFEGNEKQNFKIQTLAINHKYDIVLKEKKLERFENELQIIQNFNYSISQKMFDISESQKSQLLKYLQFKRWAQDVYQKISIYKDTLSYTEHFLKLFREIQEFIEFASEVIVRLDSGN